MDKLVSVIVPIYNVEKYLEKCLKSIINQDYQNIEILLINDGSTDSSLKICEKYKKMDKRITIINKKNGGLSSARNVGLAYANGEIISFIDSDDYIEKCMLSDMMKVYELYNADIVICNRRHFFENGNSYIKFYGGYDYKIMNSENAIEEMNKFKLFDMSACTKIYNRKLFENIIFPEGKLCEDYYIMYLLFDNCDRIVSMSKSLYNYYQREGSISKNPKLNWDYISASRNQYEYVEKKYPNLKMCVRSSFVSANMTVYNSVIANGGRIELNEMKKLRTNVSKNYEYYMKYNQNNKVKKIQVFLFLKNIYAYNIFYKFYKICEKNR